MTEEREHRAFSPSQADRFFLCPGSVALNARVPALPSSRFAIEGTHAHAVLEAALKAGTRDAITAHREWSYLFDVELDDGTNEFYLAVQTALNYIYDLIDTYPTSMRWIETEVDVEVSSAPGEANGYLDFAMYIPEERRAIVVDYKHGAGIAKEADCRQLKQYGAGLVYGTLATEAAVDTVTLVIVQPRAFHKDGPVREHTLTAFELFEYLGELDAAIAAAQAPDAPLVPGSEQCRFCDGVAYCPAREAQALALAGSAFKQITDLRRSAPPAPATLDVQRLATIRAHAGTLRKWLDDVETRCYELARQGHTIPGAKLVETKAQRKYYGDEEDVARKIAALLGDRDVSEAVSRLYDFLGRTPALRKMFRPNLVPLTTAEKLVVEAYKSRAGRGAKKAAAEDARQAFAFLTLKQTSGTLVLVDDTDERPAVNGTTSAFAQITTVFPRSNTSSGEQNDDDSGA